jgi:AsmA family protein
LLEQADITVQIKPASLSCSGNMIPRKVDVTVAGAELAVRKGLPVTAALTGTLNRVPFEAALSAGTLAELYRTDAPLPVHLTLRTADVQLKAEGAVARPFQRQEFDLEHELTGKDIKGLDPLMDVVLPLRGEFHAKGRVSARGNRFTYDEDLRVGKSDFKAAITVLHAPTRPKISGRIQAGELHLNDVALSDGDEKPGTAKDASRAIPDHTIPTDIFLAADLDLAIGAERIITEAEPLGGWVSKVKLQDGRYHSSHSVSGVMGGRMVGELDIDAADQLPSVRVRLDARDLDYRLLQQLSRNSDLIEGRIELYVELSGAGATVRRLLGNADGRVTVIGGPGRISGRSLELWAADLIPTMLSPRWQRQNMTEMNCFVAHIGLKQGLATVEDLILDTQRITVAGGGILNLETEAIDLLLAPRPKRPSFVSLANPVRIQGTLAEPDVTVARLPSRSRLMRTGLLAGLINPAFLLIAFSDTGTGVANPCGAAIERAYEAAEIDAR